MPLFRICDWIAVMDRGQLVAELPMDEFKNGIKRLHVTSAPTDVMGAPLYMDSGFVRQSFCAMQPCAVNSHGPAVQAPIRSQASSWSCITPA